MIDGFSQPLALILFPSTQMPGGETLVLTGRDGPVGECRGSLVSACDRKLLLLPWFVCWHSCETAATPSEEVDPTLDGSSVWALSHAVDF